MIQLHHYLKKTILRWVDFFYPPFRKLLPLQTFRYAACGGGNTVLNILLYFVCYNYILEKQILYLSGLAISPHIAAYLMAFCITFPIGFYLSLFVVFPESYLRKRVQLFRYLLVVLICIVLNYVFLKLFVEHLGWYPTPSMTVSTVLIVIFSYFSQRHFSFRKKGDFPEEAGVNKTSGVVRKN